MAREAVEDIRRHGRVPEQMARLIEGLRPADHVAVLEWDGRYEVVRMDVAREEAGMYRTRGLNASEPLAGPQACGMRRAEARLP